MSKKGKSKNKAEVKENFIVNPLLWFMNTRLKTTARDTILQLMLQHYDEKQITAARDLILSKYEVKKRPCKRQGSNKAIETLKDIFWHFAGDGC